MKLFEVDENKQLVPLTFFLCHSEKTPIDSIEVSNFSFNNSENKNDEISFDVYSMKNGEHVDIYDEIKDFRLVFIAEWKKYYQISVSETEGENGNIKNITGIHLSEAELSQLMLYNIEINTENDILRDDYKPCKIYDDTDDCLLHRVLSDKAPHYSVGYVSPSIANEVRVFSINNKSIDDFLRVELSEELGCIVKYDSYNNTISLYDTFNVCADCGHRWDSSSEICPECGSTNIKNDYGKYTGILISTENIAEEIKIDTDESSVKTCFKITGGDDLINSAIRYVSPSASDYIYSFTEETYADMPQDLSLKLHEYQEECKKESELYQSRSKRLFDYYDELYKYKTSMMPSIETSETNANLELNKLNAGNIGKIGINTTLSSNTPISIINNAVIGVAKIFMSPGYKVEIVDMDDYSESVSIHPTFSYDEKTKTATWIGCFHVYNYSDPENDSATDDVKRPVKLIVNSDYKTFIEQKINKSLANNEVYGKIDENTDWSQYSLDCLSSFESAFQNCLEIIMAQGAIDDVNNKQICDELYNKYSKILNGDKDSENEPRKNGLRYYIKLRQDNVSSLNLLINFTKNRLQETANKLNLKTYLGEELWKKFCSYRRDEEYNNSTYISDGLTNAEILEKAKDLVSVASTELYRASRPQYIITGTISNFLIMPEFEHIQNDCELGNWVYVQTKNGDVYKLRINGISGDFDSLEHISLTFSNAYNLTTVADKLSETISKAASIATSFSYVERQASQGEEANENINQWMSEGLNSALIQIKNNEHEEVTFDKNGITAKEYDDILKEYSPEQLKITHNIIAFTNDNWNTPITALGKHSYKTYKDTGFITQIGYGLTAQFVTSGQVNGSQIVGGDIYSENFSSDKGTHINLNDGSFSFAGGKLTYNSNTNKLNITGKITFENEDIEGYKESLGITATENNISSINKSINTINGQITSIQNDVNGTNSLASKIKEALGWSTEISSNYVISPYIGGGYLRIGNENTGKVIIDPLSATKKKIFGVYNSKNEEVIGLDDDGNAFFKGNVTATSLTLGDNIDLGYVPIGKDVISGDTPDESDYLYHFGRDGYLQARNAYISGTLIATSGYIGDYIISNGELYQEKDGKGAGIGSYGQSYAFWAGGDYDGRKESPFRVGHDGALIATKATITGNITAENGNIGGILINSGDNGGIKSNNFEFDVGLGLATNGFSISNKGSIAMTYGSIGCIQFGTQGLSTPDYVFRIVNGFGMESYAGEWIEYPDGITKPNKMSVSNASIDFSTFNNSSYEHETNGQIGSVGMIYYTQASINLNGSNSSINVSGDVCSNGTVLTSDKRLKENIKYIDTYSNYLNLAKDISLTSFNFIDDSYKKIGVIAQDIIELCKKYNIDSNSFVKEKSDGYYAVDYNALNMLSFLWLSDLENRINFK